MATANLRFSRLVRPTLNRHLLLALGAAVLLVAISAQIGAYDDYNLTAVAIFAVAAAGLTLLTGLNGQLSLGHGALMAVGAYTASLLLKDHELPVVVVLLAAVLTTGIIGIVFVYAARRVRGWQGPSSATGRGSRRQPGSAWAFPSSWSPPSSSADWAALPAPCGAHSCWSSFRR